MQLLCFFVLLAMRRPVLAMWNTCEGSCGLRPLTSDNERGMTRVVGGTNAETGAWPWLVSIQDPSVAGTGHLCGGSLISVQWVLTAAHCFADPRNISAMRVLIGATQLTEPGPGAEVRLIKRVVVHEEYGARDQSNDIALLELNEPVKCNQYIQLVCVPDATLDVARLQTCYVAGWGATTARAQKSSDILQEAKVHLINVQLCNSTEWYAGDIHPHNLCAGYPEGGIDTCQGDSGGPLMCKDNNADSFWVVGVTSWGRGCARAQRPGIYTSVKDFYDWILAKMELLPQVEASRAYAHLTTAAQPWTHQTNAAWPAQKPWSRPPSTHNPLPRPPSTHNPWPRPPSTHNPWPRPPSTYKPQPTTFPTNHPWQTTLPTHRPLHTTLHTPMPWQTTLPTHRPLHTTLHTPMPWQTTLPTHRPLHTTLHTPKPWHTTLPTHRPLQTTLPTPRPWHTTLSTPRPWHTTLPTPRPWHTTLSTPRPWHTTLPTHKPQPTIIPTHKPQPTVLPTPRPRPKPTPAEMPSAIPEPVEVEEISSCPFPIKKLVAFFTKIRDLLNNLQRSEQN